MAFVLQMLEMGKLRSPIHELNPLAKLLWWLSLVVVPILVTNPLILLAFTIWIWIMAGFAKVAGRMYQFLVVTYPLMVGFIMFTWPFFYPASEGQHFLFQWGILHWSIEGIIYAIAMGMRIILALTACTFFVMTTDLMGLASAMGEFMQNKLGISYMYPLMVISSFKFLPELSGDYLTITDSFRSRAMDIDTGSVAQRFKKTIPVAIPLIDNMLRRAMRISIALELKAFNVETKNRTFYDQYSFRRKDILFALTGLLAIGLSILAIFLNLAKVEIYL
jgi:energy-coupling factor transport system permease protein